MCVGKDEVGCLTDNHLRHPKLGPQRMRVLLQPTTESTFCRFHVLATQYKVNQLVMISSPQIRIDCNRLHQLGREKSVLVEVRMGSLQTTT